MCVCAAAYFQFWIPESLQAMNANHKTQFVASVSMHTLTMSYHIPDAKISPPSPPPFVGLGV